MAGVLKLEFTGYRDAKGRFAKRTDALARTMRDGIRDLSRNVVKTLQHYAPEDTGKFKAGISYQTTWRGPDTVRSTFYVRGEHAFLLPMLTGGTKGHGIPIGGSEAQMAKGYPLHWIDKKTGEDRFAWSVWHPGTMPNPFVAVAMDAMSPQFDIALSKMARKIAWLT